MLYISLYSKIKLIKKTCQGIALIKLVIQIYLIGYYIF